MDLLEEFSKLIAKLKGEKIEFALCGGLAMAVYAFPRATLDIDLMIESDALPALKRAAGELGYTLDSGLMRFKDGAIQIYRLAKTTPGSEDELVLDLLLVTPQIKDIWESRREETWMEGDLPIISPAGLIRLKTLRGAGQDQDDIEHLRKLIDES
jgi:hypothetical protein